MTAVSAANRRQPHPTAPSPAFRNSLLLLAGGISFVVIVWLLFTRNYDYDEISHAHMAWLVSIGEIPYEDFAANHFPFFWITLSPLMHLLPESPLALVLLRGLALTLNAVFIGSLGTLICLELKPSQRVWAVAFFLAIVFSPVAVQFLIEFRPDALANALLFSGLLWIRLRGPQRATNGLLGGFLIGFAVLINTKYILLPFVLGAIIAVLDFQRIRRSWLFSAAMVGGFLAAFGLGALLVTARHISISDAWLLVVTYNGAVEKFQSFGFGLAGDLARNVLVYIFILPALAACVVMWARRRWYPKPFEIGIFVFLVLNICTTTRPWKQYSASWMILAAGLPARMLPMFVEKLSVRWQTALAACLGGAALVYFGVNARGAPVVVIDRPSQDAAMAYSLQHVPKNGYVLASYFVHPIFRRDSLFKTVCDAELNRADGLEQFMPTLAPGAYGERFQESGYEKDLETRRPDLILVQAGYTLLELQAMTNFINRHPDAYSKFQIPGTQLTVLQAAQTNVAAPNPPKP